MTLTPPPTPFEILHTAWMQWNDPERATDLISFLEAVVDDSVVVPRAAVAMADTLLIDIRAADARDGWLAREDLATRERDLYEAWYAGLIREPQIDGTSIRVLEVVA